MHVQVVNFNLKDMTEDAYQELCDQSAPTFGAMPGLIAKYFLADRETNTYGGVYIWESPEAMAAYVNGEIWAAVAANPNLTNITTRDYGVLEGPTRVTHGFAAAAAVH
jgi:hypothetical protein